MYKFDFELTNRSGEKILIAGIDTFMERKGDTRVTIVLTDEWSNRGAAITLRQDQLQDVIAALKGLVK